MSAAVAPLCATARIRRALEAGERPCRAGVAGAIEADLRRRVEGRRALRADQQLGDPRLRAAARTRSRSTSRRRRWSCRRGRRRRSPRTGSRDRPRPSPAWSRDRGRRGRCRRPARPTSSRRSSSGRCRRWRARRRASGRTRRRRGWWSVADDRAHHARGAGQRAHRRRRVRTGQDHGLRRAAVRSHVPTMLPTPDWKRPLASACGSQRSRAACTR